MSQELYLNLLDKIGIEKEFITKAIYLPLQKSNKTWQQLEERRKTWIDERLREVYQHDSDYRSKLYKKIYKSYDDGYPCEECQGTRLFYDPTQDASVTVSKETYRKKLTYKERMISYIPCEGCYEDMDKLVDLKMIVEGIVNASKLWVYPKNREAFGNCGSIYELLSKKSHDTEENKLLHETYYELVGGEEHSKLEQLNYSTKPKNSKASKTKQDRFLHLFNYKYQSEININHKTQDQLEYFDLYINNKIEAPKQLNYNSSTAIKVREFGSSIKGIRKGKEAAEFTNK